MDSLKDIISSFKVNTVDERNLLNSNEAPNVFYKVAECMLAGHFLVTDGHKDVLVRPTVLEFYYHEEKNGGIKDPIVYHKTQKIPNIGLCPKTDSGKTLSSLQNYFWEKVQYGSSSMIMK